MDVRVDVKAVGRCFFMARKLAVNKWPHLRYSVSVSEIFLVHLLEGRGKLTTLLKILADCAWRIIAFCFPHAWQGLILRTFSLVLGFILQHQRVLSFLALRCYSYTTYASFAIFHTPLRTARACIFAISSVGFLLFSCSAYNQPFSWIGRLSDANSSPVFRSYNRSEQRSGLQVSSTPLRFKALVLM